MNKAKVYGIQRSGNNWLQWLLAANYRVKIMGANFGWTHGPYSTDAELAGTLNLVISKHPVEWLPSMHRFHKVHRGLTLAKFIRTADAIEKWNSLYAGHVANAEAFGARFIRYDDLLADPEGVLEATVAGDLARKDQPFRSADGQHMNTRMLPTSRKFDKNHYLKKVYLNHYTPELLEEVQARVDWKVASALGYERIAL